MIADTFHLQGNKRINIAKDKARSQVLDLFEVLWADNEKLIEIGAYVAFDLKVEFNCYSRKLDAAPPISTGIASR